MLRDSCDIWWQLFAKAVVNLFTRDIVSVFGENQRLIRAFTASPNPAVESYLLSQLTAL